MTHKPPQGIDARPKMEDGEMARCESFYDNEGNVIQCLKSKGHVSMHQCGSWLWKDEAAAPPDPRKDLAARLANVPTLVAGDFLADGFVTPAMQKYVATLVQKRLDEALAEMRGAGR